MIRMYSLLLLFVVTARATLVSNVADLINLTESSTSSVTIRVSGGLYLFDDPITLSNVIANIVGVEGEQVIFNGQNSSRIFALLSDASLSLQNVILEDGRGEAVLSEATGNYENIQGGGCIAMYNFQTSTGLGVNAPTLSINQVTFQNCFTTTGSGGAIMVSGAPFTSLTITDSTFFGNSATSSSSSYGQGGAVYFSIYAGNPATAFYFDNTIFLKNRARDGGAVYIGAVAGSSEIQNSSFTRNSASASGGAISLNAFTTLLTSTFDDNVAPTGEGSAVNIECSVATCYLLLDVPTSHNITNSDGSTGYNLSTYNVICAPSPWQVQVIYSTSAPVSSPPTHFPTHTPTIRTGPTPTSLPIAPTTAPPDSGSDVILIACFAVIGCVLVGAVIFGIGYCRRKAAALAAARAAEAENSAFNQRRLFKPKVVLFKEIVPREKVAEPCAICGEPVPEDSTVGRALGSISAGRAGLNSALTLSDAFGRVECGHIFHVACVITWTEINGHESCPSCRRVIAQEEKRRNSSHSSTDSTKMRPSRSAPTLTSPSTVLTISISAQLALPHIARRSTNGDDLLAENVILVRERNEAQSRPVDRSISDSDLL